MSNLECTFDVVGTLQISYRLPCDCLTTVPSERNHACALCLSPLACTQLRPEAPSPGSGTSASPVVALRIQNCKQDYIPYLLDQMLRLLITQFYAASI